MIPTDTPVAVLASLRARARRLSGAGSAIALLAIVLIAVGFLNPIFRGSTFSAVAGHQNVIYPWRAYPTGFADVYPQTDEAEEFYPWQVLMGDALKDGHVPYWDPNTFAGSPFFTNGTSGVVYPVRLILGLAVSPSWAHDLFVLFHLALAGILMFVLMRSFGVGRLSALLAGTAWMLNSYSLAWAQLEHVLVVTALLPGGVWLVRETVVRSGRRATLAGVGCGVTMALMILGGNAEIVLLAYLTIVAYGACLAARKLLVRRRLGTTGQAAGGALRVVAAALLAPAIAAVSLLPTALVFNDLAREPFSYTQLLHEFAVPLRAFVATVLPPSGLVTSDDMNTNMVYMGVPAVFLALVGAFRRKPGAALGRTLAVVTALVVLGTPLTWLAYHLIPGFGFFRPLGRALFLWNFAIAILSGLGLDVTIASLRRHTYQLGQRVDVATVIGCLAILLTAIQCAQYGRNINPPFHPRERRYLYPVTPEVRALLSEKESAPAAAPQRVIPVRPAQTNRFRTPSTFDANVSSVFGVESVAGYESVLPNRTVNLWRVVAGESVQEVIATRLRNAYRPWFFHGAVRLDLLPRLGITTIIAPPDLLKDKAWRRRPKPIKLKTIYAGRDGRLLRVVAAAPRAYVVRRVVPADSPRAALDAFTSPSFDSGAEVILEGAGVSRRAGQSSRRRTATEAATVDVDWNRESYRVRARRGGWLVVLASWDPGWSARVNGRPAKILRADYAFRAVRVPSGVSRIDFFYEPAGLRVGLGITLGAMGIAAALVLVALFPGMRRFRRTTKHNS